MDTMKKITQYDLRILKRRDFLRVFLLGGIFSFFSRKVGAEDKSEEMQKEAMFWHRLD